MREAAIEVVFFFLICKDEGSHDRRIEDSGESSLPERKVFMDFSDFFFA